jgi:hypothetical protein
MTSPRHRPDDPPAVDAAVVPVWATVVRFPSRMLFISVALVQIAVEMAVTAAHDLWDDLTRPDER